MSLFSNCYYGKKIVVTGHSGFKGSWLSLWLQALGAEVIGISLPPLTHPNHWDLLQLDMQSHWINIQNADQVKTCITKVNPDMVFHLAAQPLVRRSYLQPLDTWMSNVMGTAHVLEACRSCTHLKGILIVTTDKCYDNKEWVWDYRETDSLGGHDPYSASKAAAEFVSASYRKSFFNNKNAPLLATARAGNVIGGGDWAEDRLIPDVINAVNNKQSLEIRSPHAVRPWQHVLDCLSGYLLLGQKLLEGKEEYADAWNFGPHIGNHHTVEEMLHAFKSYWPALSWHCKNEKASLHEMQHLQLNINKARQKLKWQPLWAFDETIEKTAEWYQAWLKDKTLLSTEQLKEYRKSAIKNKVNWVSSDAIEVA